MRYLLILLLAMSMVTERGWASCCAACASCCGAESSCASGCAACCCETNGGCGSFVLTGEYLYWKAEQTGMTYAIGLDNLTDNTTITDFHQHFDWSSAFRIGVGYDFPCNCFGLNFSWTRYHSNFSGSDSAPFIIATEVLSNNLPFLIGGTSNGGRASSAWHLNFDMLDLDFGSCLFANNWFTFSPYIGVKGGWIYQKQEIIYDNFRIDGVGDLVNVVVDECNHFSGAGPKFGFSGDFRICNNFTLFSNFSTALLYGHANNPNHAEITGGALGSPAFRYSQNKLLPTLQMLMGLNWQTRCFDCYGLNLGLGYEVQYFWNTWRNQNSTIQEQFITDAGYGDLMFQGLTAQLAICF